MNSFPCTFKNSSLTLHFTDSQVREKRRTPWPLTHFALEIIQGLKDSRRRFHCVKWKQLRNSMKELIAWKNVALEGKMFKWSLKETGCQEQFSNQRGIKRFHLYFTLIQKTCLHGEVVLKWTHQLKWKNFPTIQHEKGPLVNVSRCWGTQGMPQKKVKEELPFDFDWMSISIPEEMSWFLQKSWGSFIGESWNLSGNLEVSHCEDNIHLYGVRYCFFLLYRGHGPNGVGNRC